MPKRTFKDKVDNVFRAAVGRRVTAVNLHTELTSPQTMEVTIYLSDRAVFRLETCDPITNEICDTIKGCKIDKVAVEIGDEKSHWLPARLLLQLGDVALDIVTHAPIYFMDEKTGLFERFPVPMRLKDDRYGYHNVQSELDKRGNR